MSQPTVMPSDEEPAASFPRSRLSTPAAQPSTSNPMSPPSPGRSEPCQLKPIPPKDDERSTMVDEFAAFLRSAVPTQFIPQSLHCYMVRESNARLEMAKAAGVELGELSIGHDCLPTWAGLHWDPDTESLHTTIQNRLIDFQVSRDLGDLVRGEVIANGNLKLSQAREMGIDIKDLSIGFSLLPTWRLARGGEVETATIVEDNESALDSEATVSEAEDFSATVTSDVTLITPMTDVFDSHSLPGLRPGSLFSTSGSDGDGGDGGNDSDDSDDSDDEFDDEITLQNFVSPLPVYEDGDAINVFHDVQLVGGPEGMSEVDLEVWLVEDDDDDVADLPEVELAVNREDFELLFGDDEAIDVEIPGTELFCLDGLEEAFSDAAEMGDDEPTRPDSCSVLTSEEGETTKSFEELSAKGAGDDDSEASVEDDLDNDVAADDQHRHDRDDVENTEH